MYKCIYSAVYNQHNQLFCLLLCSVCPQKERTCETRSLSAESWQSCWTTRRACLTQRTMTSPPPTTTAPLMNRYLLFLTSSSSQSITPSLSHCCTVSGSACISSNSKHGKCSHLFFQELFNYKWHPQMCTYVNGGWTSVVSSCHIFSSCCNSFPSGLNKLCFVYSYSPFHTSNGIFLVIIWPHKISV